MLAARRSLRDDTDGRNEVAERGLRGDVSVRTGLDPDHGGRPVSDSEPFRLLLIADFSARGSRGEVTDLAARAPKRVDRDDLDDVLAGLDARLHVHPHAGAEAIELRPRSLDDLHPDALWNELDVFAELRSLRRRLADPDTYEAARDELRGASDSTAPPEAAAGASPAPEPGGDLLDAAIAETSRAEGPSSLVDAVLRELVVPKLPDGAEQAELIATVDAAAADEMRAILADASFRRLEAAWRASQLLVRRLETDAQLQVWIFDASLEELVRDVATHADPRDTGLWRALFEGAASDDEPRFAAWAALDLACGARPAQIALLGRFARLAHAAATPLLASARSDLAGSPAWVDADHPSDWTAVEPDVAEAWAALRALPESRWVLLATPRLLLRAPYGRRTSPLEHFELEEVTPGAHAELCWGSGATLAVWALGRRFAERGWGLELRARSEIDGLPLCIAPDRHGDAMAQPCAEVVLTERASDALEELGLTPLLSVRESDRVRIETLRGLDGAPLAGRWARTS